MATCGTVRATWAPMLRTTLASVTLVTALTSYASADPKADLDAAIAAAEDGRCDEALELTREIGQDDRAFYAAHVPSQPALAACIRARVTKTRAEIPAPRLAPTASDEGTGKAGQILLATGAGTLAWLGTAYLTASFTCGNEIGCGDDEGPNSTMIFTASAGLAVATTAAVYLAGHDSAHDDSLAATATGAVALGLLGTMVGAPMLYDNALLGAAVIVGSSALGATIGFHVGRSSKKKRGLEIVPAAGGGFTGAILGGTF
jgi:hypothetical protein